MSRHPCTDYSAQLFENQISLQDAESVVHISSLHHTVAESTTLISGIGSIKKVIMEFHITKREQH